MVFIFYWCSNIYNAQPWIPMVIFKSVIFKVVNVYDQGTEGCCSPKWNYMGHTFLEPSERSTPLVFMGPSNRGFYCFAVGYNWYVEYRITRNINNEYL